MTNIVAVTGIVMVLTSTNWTHIGTFTALDGSTFKVEQGQLVTNEVLCVEWNNTERQFPLGDQPQLGPIIGERKTLTSTPMFQGRFEPKSVNMTNVLPPIPK